MDTKQLKQKILDLAIRGKLVPQDPNDEPASVLLERIRKEKEQLIAAGKLKKSKAKASDTPHYENVPFEIPASWEWVALKDVCTKFSTGPFGSMLHKSDYSSEGVPVVNPANIVNGQINIDKIMYVKKEKSLELSKYNLFLNDILLARRGDLSKCAIATSENIGWLCGTGSFVLHLCLIESYYFKLIYATQYIQSILATASVGATMDNLNQDTFSKILIPIPPLEEQKRIINGVHEWYNLIDSIDTNKKELSKAIEETKSRVLSLAISGKLVSQSPTDEPAIELLKRINPAFKPCDTSHYANLPKGWQVTPMQKLCNLAEGEKQTGINRIYLDVKYLRGKGEKVIAQNGKYVPAGSTMILVDGENSGEIFTTPIEGYQGSTFKLLNISGEIYKPFILYVIKSYQKQFRENKVGSAIPHLNKKLFREIDVFVPPFEEQKRIVKKIDAIFETVDQITAEL